MGRYRKIDHFLDRLDDDGVRDRGRSRAPADEPDAAEERRVARVLANYGIQCLVRRDDGTEARLPIHRRLAAAAGDLAEVDDERIVALRPRRAVLARADHKRSQILAANVDRVVLVQSASDPPYREGLTDRYQVFAAVMDIPLILVLNKIDEARPGIRDATGRHEALGVRVVETSAAAGAGVEELARLLASGLSVLSGHSGVGKSSLLRALIPGLAIDVGDLHETRRRGRQTTTTSRAYPFREGYVIDTPGVRQFSLVGVEPGEVSRAFPDIAALAAGCRFRDCLHRTEPGCAVVAAAAGGTLDAARYDSYRRIVESLAI